MKFQRYFVVLVLLGCSLIIVSCPNRSWFMFLDLNRGPEIYDQADAGVSRDPAAEMRSYPDEDDAATILLIGAVLLGIGGFGRRLIKQPDSTGYEG